MTDEEKNQEIYEAIRAGEEALKALEDAAKALNSARNMGSWICWRRLFYQRGQAFPDRDRAGGSGPGQA